MKVFPATARDNERGMMRVEIAAEDIEILEYASGALETLAIIEDSLGVKGFVSPFITGEDLPTMTRQASNLLHEFQIGWDGGDFDEMINSGEIVVVFKFYISGDFLNRIWKTNRPPIDAGWYTRKI